jgi:hypothetical protein
MENLVWNYYRPDVIGIAEEQGWMRIVLGECETNPTLSSIREKASKISHTMKLQKKLNKNHTLKFLLVIPFGKLKRVNHSEFRELWDIWILGNKGRIIYRIPKIKCI